MRLPDKVAIVTGGASGIGRGTCLRLAEEGAHVAAFDTDLEGAQNVADEIARAGGTARAFKVDVSNTDQVEAAVKEAISALGAIDILVNNAGMSSTSTVVRTTDELWDRMHEVNLKGTFLCCRALAPHMKKRRYGKIINIASILAGAGSAYYAHYSSTKAGVVGFTRGLAMELGPYDINVNVVGPGVIETPMLDRDTTPELRQRTRERVALRRLGTPLDIANAVLFLASDEASYITGQCLYVCGGLSAGSGLG